MVFFHSPSSPPPINSPVRPDVPKRQQGKKRGKKNVGKMRRLLLYALSSIYRVRNDELLRPGAHGFHFENKYLRPFWFNQKFHIFPANMSTRHYLINTI